MLYRAAAQHQLCAAQARLHSSAAAVLSIAHTRPHQYSREASLHCEAGRQVDSSSPSVWQSHGGWYLHTSWQQQQQQQLADPHPLSAAPNHPPTVAIVDGHSLVLSTSAARGSQSLSSAGVVRQLEEWLRHLKQYTRADVLYVAFDNKGSAASNARAQLLPAYLSKRYKKQPPPGGGPGAPTASLPLSTVSSRAPASSTLPDTWSVNPFDPRRAGSSYNTSATATTVAASTGISTSSRYTSGAAARKGTSASSSVPRAWLDAVAAAGGVAVPAALGYEADDVAAALVAWCEQQAPAPLVFLVSADADLWQLTSPTTVWLQLARGPTRACPAGLVLHTAEGFQQQHGYPPMLHGDVLALIGKPEAGVPGAGVSKRACKQLLLRHGTLQAILHALHSAEGPAPALRQQLQQLWGNLSSAEVALEAAQQRLPVVQLQPAAQSLPAAVGQAYTAGGAAVRQSGPVGGSTEAAAQQLALLHPPQRHHQAQCAPYRRLLCQALDRLGLGPYQEDWLSPEGYLFDMVVARPPKAQQQQQQQQQDLVPPWLPATCWVVQLVAPSQFRAATSGSNSRQMSQQAAVAALAQQLQQQVAPCRGRLTGPLKGQLRNAAAGQLALHVRSQWRVVLVPFQELWVPGTAGQAAARASAPAPAGPEGPPQLVAVDAAAEYLRGLLADQE